MKLFSIAALSLMLSPAVMAQPSTQPVRRDKLYVVGYAHLDTQWRWSYPQVISEFIPNTMRENFKLIDQYPDYIFNFTGASRYMMMKQYYPEDYQKLKGYIAAGRWYPNGSSMEEGDVDMPSAEGIIRQVLYGNEFFEKEFHMASSEFMLPDCFGFQASLPSILAHCGLKGFSTQKLTWGSAVGIPFNVGVWQGPDGRSIVAALNPGAYSASITDDLSHDKKWIDRINEDGAKSGVYVDYHYYGTGDQGGAPRESSVQWLEKSVHGGGPVEVISSKADQMFNDLTAKQIAELPRYSGDLLLTNHSTGSLTSEAYIKRLNRKNEQLASAAEAASIMADYFGAEAYPFHKLFTAWRQVLGAHFHDTMAGTALPVSYQYSWNNEFIASNEFAAITQNAAGAVISAMDTRVQGTPIVVYNPLSFARSDVVQATLPEQMDAVEVIGPDGKLAPSQIISDKDGKTKILFLASAPSAGFATYDIRPGSASSDQSNELKVTQTTLENAHFRVTLNKNGDIDSIYDKVNNRPVFAAPSRLAFIHQRPIHYPAWNMDWDDQKKGPYAYVDGPATIRVIESGPVRAAIEVTRESQGSRFIQDIRLCAGDAGNKITVANKIDWRTSGCSLKAVFPLTVSNPMATYESQSAAVQRGNDNEKKFEVPQQQWLDLTASNGSYGSAILNDCKYGSDKPDDNTVRLTLLYTPGVRNDFQDQATQDFGRHDFLYAIAPHAGDWQHGNIPNLARQFNQPLIPFIAQPHPGALGKVFSMMQIDNSHVVAIAMKKSEDNKSIIVRLHEVNGTPADNVHVSFAAPIQSAEEVDGQERQIGPATLRDGKLVVNMTPFILRAFAIHLEPAQTAEDTHLTAAKCQMVPLSYNLDAVSTRSSLSDGAFDSAGRTYPAESLPAKITSEGIQFTLGSTADGQKNAVICQGQYISLPSGFNRVYILASAVKDTPAKFQVGDQPANRLIQSWTGYIGQWDLRKWEGKVPEIVFDWKNKYLGLKPGYTKPDTVAWFSPVRRSPTQGNQYYKFTYLFKYGFDLPAGARSITLPNDPNVRVFAITVAKNTHDQAVAARPLYDTLADHHGDDWK